MNVISILKLKGRAVTTTTPTTLLIEGARKLASKKIGALVVVGSDGNVAGILSERDVVRAIAEHGADALNRPVSTVMTAAVVTCSEADTLDQLMEQMTARRFRHLPVVTDGALVGIVSIGDVVKHHIAEVEMEASAMRDYIAQG
ncbi:MAG: CBS domain-containing protein [Hyphomicrobiaceae bacterium]